MKCKPMATLNDQTSHAMTCVEWAGVVVFGCIGAAVFYLFAYLMLS